MAYSTDRYVGYNPNEYDYRTYKNAYRRPESDMSNMDAYLRDQNAFIDYQNRLADEQAKAAEEAWVRTLSPEDRAKYFQGEAEFANGQNNEPTRANYGNENIQNTRDNQGKINIPTNSVKKNNRKVAPKVKGNNEARAFNAYANYDNNKGNADGQQAQFAEGNGTYTGSKKPTTNTMMNNKKYGNVSIPANEEWNTIGNSYYNARPWSNSVYKLASDNYPDGDPLHNNRALLADLDNNFGISKPVTLNDVKPQYQYVNSPQHLKTVGGAEYDAPAGIYQKGMRLGADGNAEEALTYDNTSANAIDNNSKSGKDVTYNQRGGKINKYQLSKQNKPSDYTSNYRRANKVGYKSNGTPSLNDAQYYKTANNYNWDTPSWDDMIDAHIMSWENDRSFQRPIDVNVSSKKNDGFTQKAISDKTMKQGNGWNTDANGTKYRYIGDVNGGVEITNRPPNYEQNIKSGDLIPSQAELKAATSGKPIDSNAVAQEKYASEAEWKAIQDEYAKKAAARKFKPATENAPKLEVGPSKINPAKNQAYKEAMAKRAQDEFAQRNAARDAAFNKMSSQGTTKSPAFMAKNAIRDAANTVANYGASRINNPSLFVDDIKNVGKGIWNAQKASMVPATAMMGALGTTMGATMQNPYVDGAGKGIAYAGAMAAQIEASLGIAGVTGLTKAFVDMFGEAPTDVFEQEYGISAEMFPEAYAEFLQNSLPDIQD